VICPLAVRSFVDYVNYPSIVVDVIEFACFAVASSLNDRNFIASKPHQFLGNRALAID